MNPFLELTVILLLGGLSQLVIAWAFYPVLSRREEGIRDHAEEVRTYAAAALRGMVTDLRNDLRDLREERRQLLELVVKLRERGEEMSGKDFHQATDTRWEGGKYTMDGEEAPEKAQEKARLLAELRTELDAAL